MREPHGAPDKPLPAGSRIVPDLATGFPKITNGGKTYTYTAPQERAFQHRGARDGAGRRAHDQPRPESHAQGLRTRRISADIVGAKAVLAGKAKAAVGVVAHGNRLTIRLTKPLGDFNARVARRRLRPAGRRRIDDPGRSRSRPAPQRRPTHHRIRPRRPGRDREKSLLPRAPGRIAWTGSSSTSRSTPRPHSIASIAGSLDYAWVPTGDYADRAAELQRKYGINRKRFFAVPASFLRYFVLNTSQPALQGQRRPPARRELRRRPEGAARARGRPLAGFLTDQYLPPGLPGFRDAHIYPLERPDLKTGAAARQRRHAKREGDSLHALRPRSAQRRRRSSRRTSRASGSRSGSRRSRARSTSRRSPRPESRSTSRGPAGSPTSPIPRCSTTSSQARTAPIRTSPASTRRRTTRGSIEHRASWGSERYAMYGRLDVDLARDAAPAIAYAYDNALTLVSKRVGLHRPEPVPRPRGRLPEVATPAPGR